MLQKNYVATKIHQGNAEPQNFPLESLLTVDAMWRMF
jgi:hypothetical protein